MANESGEQLKTAIKRGPVEGLLSHDMIRCTAAEVSILKRKVDFLTLELENLRKYVKRSCLEKFYDMFRKIL